MENYNLKDLNKEQLFNLEIEMQKLKKDIETEMKRRRGEEEEALWNNVKKAIAEYTSVFGYIEICDEHSDMLVDENDNFETKGKIWVN